MILVIPVGAYDVIPHFNSSRHTLGASTSLHRQARRNEYPTDKDNEDEDRWRLLDDDSAVVNLRFLSQSWTGKRVIYRETTTSAKSVS